jgi:hypothetical protein
MKKGVLGLFFTEHADHGSLKFTSVAAFIIAGIIFIDALR